MNFFKRAIVSIKRKPGKTAILLLLVFILGNIISGAISVQQAVRNTENNLRNSLPAVASLELDDDALWEHERRTGEWPEWERLTPEIIQQIGALPYVQTFDYSVSASLFGSLERFWNPEFEDVLGEDWNSLPGVDDLATFILTGVHNPELIDIQENVIELVSGRIFTEQEMSSFNGVNSVAIVSRNFAELNNLTVGSTFILDNTLYDDSDMDQMNWRAEDLYTEENVFARESYEFEVVGIFELLAEIDTGEAWMDAHRTIQMENQIYVPNVVAEAAITFIFEQQVEMGVDWIDEDADAEDNFWFQPTYVLENPTELTAFAEAATELLPDFWRVSDLSNTFADIASSMETMQWLASIVLGVAVGATLLILSLLITLFLRDRKHEIGIYLALGEKKVKIVSQIILEVGTVAVVAITLALFSGSLLAGNMSERMLREQLIAQQQENMWQGSTGSGSLDWFSGGNMTTEEMLASYDLSLDATTVVVFYGVGVGAILVSTIIPITYILRLDPKKIMM